jgi:hypothetical protein
VVKRPRWVRWRLVAICLAVGAILPLLTLAQALVNVHRIRSAGGSAEAKAAAQVAADYLVGATFSFDTLGTLVIWGLEIAVVSYGLSLAVIYLRSRLKREQHG